MTSNTSMAIKQNTYRINNKVALNSTVRKINNIDIKTDTCRLSFLSAGGVEQNTEGATGNDWANIFTDSPGGVYPAISIFSPNLSTKWDTDAVNILKYNGDASIISIFGNAVFKLADSVQTTTTVQLAIWTKKLTDANFILLEESQAICIPDRAHINNKATSSLIVNIVVPITKGESVQLKIRNGTSSTVNCLFLQADLFCRPVELHGTDK